VFKIELSVSDILLLISVEMNHAPDYGHEEAIDNAPEEVGAPQSPVYENSATSKAIQSTDLSKTSPQKPSDPAKSKVHSKLK
jgi:hypothetical protein